MIGRGSVVYTFLGSGYTDLNIIEPELPGMNHTIMLKVQS